MRCRPYFRLRDGRSMRRHAASYSYDPPQVKAAYGLPAALDGAGQKIGVVELGGAFSQADYDAAMARYGVPTQQVYCAGPQSPDPGGADVEVMLDACVIGGLAPKAQLRLYFADNTDSAFVAAVRQAAAECDAVSVSWGAPEANWQAPSRAAMDAAIQAAAAAGVNVYVASGDNGSSDGGSGNNVDYPASSPYAVACGGTYTVISGASLVSEQAWSDGGGGYSAAYPMPAWQKGLANGSARGVPDVAGPADPNSGWNVVAGGAVGSVGGTSAVAPMWAAINALLNQAAGKRVGPADVLLYAHPGAFRDEVSGSNGAYSAGPGWDPCTGLGTPDGAKLVALVTGGVTPPPPPPPVPPPPPSQQPLYVLTTNRNIPRGGLILAVAPAATPKSSRVAVFAPGNSPFAAGEVFPSADAL